MTSQTIHSLIPKISAIATVTQLKLAHNYHCDEQHANWDSAKADWRISFGAREITYKCTKHLMAAERRISESRKNVGAI